MTRPPHRFNPRDSVIPVLLAFVGGLSMHVVDQLLNFRAGPVPILFTAPAVASLAYLRYRPDTSVRTMGLLLAWGFVGTGLAILAVALHAISYQLPRAMTEPEMILYDFGLFLWFVASLSGTYTMAARTAERNRYSVAMALAGPILQAGWALVVVLAVEVGGYG